MTSRSVRPRFDIHMLVDWVDTGDDRPWPCDLCDAAVLQGAILDLGGQRLNACKACAEDCCGVRILMPSAIPADGLIPGLALHD